VAPRNEDPTLIIRVINFELVEPICPGYIHVTDGRTDGRTTYDSNTALALRPSRGKKYDIIYIRYSPPQGHRVKYRGPKCNADTSVASYKHSPESAAINVF